MLVSAFEICAMNQGFSFERCYHVARLRKRVRLHSSPGESAARSSSTAEKTGNKSQGGEKQENKKGSKQGDSEKGAGSKQRGSQGDSEKGASQRVMTDTGEDDKEKYKELKKRAHADLPRIFHCSPNNHVEANVIE